MNRNILLVEPGYKTKFPPLGLMKLSTYHKLIGDRVDFVKGVNSHKANDMYWDRIYVSTMFTYNWKVTINTINYYKSIVRGDINRIKVGGILATLMKNELMMETGVLPTEGLIDYPNAFSDDNDIIIDDLIPDYSLFNNSINKYSLIDDSYFGYATRGCIRKCKFCAVHSLEGKFIDYNGNLKQYIKTIDDQFGTKRNLVLFDNNIIASKHLSNIIHDIIDLGFGKGSRNENKLRYVDFNQGTDARLINNKTAKLLSKISIKPLRIAFDYLGLEKTYVKAIRTAAKYNIKHLSNYILYNYLDTPEELWTRLKINIDLNIELGLHIYSFPMKYIPLNSKDRSYIGKNWNWYFIRGVQRITNVMKGAVMPRKDFFLRAFGENLEEFNTILHMPEKILMNRGKSVGVEEMEWKNKFHNLSNNQKSELIEYLCKHKNSAQISSNIAHLHSSKLKDIMHFYINDIDKAQMNIPLGYNNN